MRSEKRISKASRYRSPDSHTEKACERTETEPEIEVEVEVAAAIGRT
jgi:hypothetical protein